MSLGFSCCFLSTAASNATHSWHQTSQTPGLQLLPESAANCWPALPSGDALTSCNHFSTHSNVRFADKWSSLPVVAGFIWNPISGHCLTRSAVSAHPQASLVTTTPSDSEFPATCEQLQLPSVRLCTPGVLCPAMVHRDGQTHTSLSSAADLT